MKTGDSFFIAETNKDVAQAIGHRIRSSVSQRAKRNGEKYTVAMQPGGVRVWRIA